MKFRINECPSIPCMAWCIVMTKNIDVVELYVGNMVESFDDFFVEGVWDGVFSERDLENSELFCGTAGKIKQDKVILYTPSHNLDRIVTLQDGDKLFASNSLPFILEISNNKLDTQYLKYEYDLCSIKNGIKEYCRDIPLANKKALSIHYFCNIEISLSLEINVKEKTRTKSVENFDDYHDGLLDVLERIKENSVSKERKHKFGLVTTISKGYDSACCAAMAKKIGCNIALTFNHPAKYADDNGDIVARQLGYTDIRYADANHYRYNTDLVEAYHTATGELGSTICFEAFTDDFKNNIVFYGERGDQFWTKSPINPNSNFKFTNQLVIGIGMAEWRLNVGFVLMPIAFYKGVHWEDICKISNSSEMASWSIGGDYDRPIPRRICEDMGVERKEFGQAKKGAGFNYNRDNLSRIKSRMSTCSFSRFYEFYKKNKRKLNVKANIIYIWNMLPDYLTYIFSKLHLKISFEKKEFDLTNPGSPSYLISWGVEECMQRYKF